MITFVERNNKLKEFLSETSEVCAFLWERGYAERNAGNISANITDLISSPYQSAEFSDKEDLTTNYTSLAGKYFFVTATGKRMRDISKDILSNSLIIKINDDGNSYYKISKDNNKKIHPTSELLTHLCLHQELLKSDSQNKIILHTHATDLIALTQNKDLKNQDVLNNILWGMHPETIIVIPEGIGFIPYMLPGSLDIALATIEKLKKHKLILWEKHGVFSIGKNILDMFDTIDVANKSAAIYLQCKSAGYEPEGFNEIQLNGLRELAKKFMKD